MHTMTPSTLHTASTDASASLHDRFPARTHQGLGSPWQDDSLVRRGLEALRDSRQSFDDSVYQSARLQFLEIAQPYLGGSIPYTDFVRIFFSKAIEKFGDGVKAYAIRFCKECEAQFAQPDQNKNQKRKPVNLANNPNHAIQEERYRKLRIIFDRETLLGSWKADNPAISATLKAFQQLAEDQFERAYYPLSVLILARDHGHEDATQARRLAELAFEHTFARRDQDDPTLWCDLGDMYRDGHGVAPDRQQAEHWHRKAAERGYARAQWSLGLELYDGEHPDAARNSEALEWMGLAAAQGDPMLQCWLGDVYRMSGRHENALQWYGRAVAQDDKEGLFKLGTMYEAGHGVPQDDDAAQFWFRKAARQGHAEAQWQLGQLQEYDLY